MRGDFMKKRKWLWIVIAGLMVAAFVCTLVYVVRYSIASNVGVFDMANFWYTTVFSLLGIAFSAHEVIKANASEKAVEVVRKAVSDKVQDQYDAVRDIEDICACNVFNDFPTYSDCTLEKMCELFHGFHQGIEVQGKPGKKLTLQASADVIEGYIHSVEEVLGLIVKRGEYLPPMTVAMAISLCEDTTKINKNLVNFRNKVGINAWTILKIQETEVYGADLVEKQQYLYREGCQLCMLFEELFAQVQSNYKRFEMLCEAILQNENKK